ncbi:hypothetical protein VNI00_000678 [Paramarasmius palmivorus]|uniref:Uncharacterized protein n=1 Tax=Paramarasmius palmivorus TaxID=297713 RepID=A0AAW0E9V2_9AGAR
MYALFSLAFIPLLLLSAHGANHTVYLDDTASEITYVEAWGQGNTCDQCFLKPDTSKAFQGTWHDFTYFQGKSDPAALQIQFNGVSLEVFCILPANNVNAVLAYSLSFELDGEAAGQNYTKGPASLTDQYQYNVSVIALTDLENKEHNFTMKLDTAIDNVVLFDYAVVGTEDNSKNLTSTPVGPSFITSATVAGPTITGSGGSRNGNNGAPSMKASVWFGGLGLAMGALLNT